MARDGQEVDCRLARKKGRGKRTEVGREARSFSTKLGLKVFKECQRGTRYPFSLRPSVLSLPLPLRLITVS